MAIEPKTTNKTLVVGCNLPCGLEVQVYENGRAKGDPFILRGANDPDAVAGFGITQNVDAAAFGAWMSQHPDLPAVKRGMIFGEDNMAKARDHAIAFDGLTSGFEGINPEKPASGVLPDTYQGRPTPEPSPRSGG